MAAIPVPLRSIFAKAVVPFVERNSSRIPFVHPGLVLAAARFSQRMQQAASLSGAEQYCFLRSYYTPESLEAMLSPEVRSAAHLSPMHRLMEHFEACAGEDALNQLLYVDCNSFLPDFNLTYSDKLSMACSIEARVPFLDNEVVNFSLRLPSNLKIKGLTQKYLLRKAFSETLPPSVLNRRKAGFGLPIRSWLRVELREMFHDVLG
jgi:asparagine synthase (glutamine-hydrolysing)